MSRFSKETRYKKALVGLWISAILSMAIDAVLLFVLGRSLVTVDTFRGAFGAYAFLISLPVGLLLAVILACLTRNSYKANDKTMSFVFARAVLVWIMGMVATFVNRGWIGNDPMDSATTAGGVFGWALIVGLFSQGAAFFLSSKILDAMPTRDSRPSVKSASFSGRSYPDPEEERRKQEEEEYKKHWDIVNSQ